MANDVKEDKNLTNDEFEELEGKLIQAAKNAPSGKFKVGDVFVSFKRPKLFNKYKGRVWANRKLKDIGIDDPDNDEQGLVFYYRFIGALCMSVATIEDAKGKKYELGDGEYEFLLEKYLEEEINDKGKNEEPFIDELSTAYAEWEKGTPTEEEVKKS